MGKRQGTLENMEMNFDFWKNRNVFLTGHTGFKGGWTSFWLSQMGANVYGYSLSPPATPNFFTETKLENYLSGSIFSNILDLKNLKQAIKDAKPSVIIHMAAQSLVRKSYSFPLETFVTNVTGTVNVLEAARQAENVKAIINVTSDKCYENNESNWSYRESDRLGGHDPYSSSKACAELIATAYQKSFFTELDIHLASVRAGNVIGGGDWGIDRLIPDFFKALDLEQSLSIRSPNSIRPWQHVLEPISGYLMLAEKLVLDGNKYAGPWNFGPNENNTKSVSQISDYLCSKIKKSSWIIDNSSKLHEAQFLKIDSSKAKNALGWQHQWDLDTTLNKTIDWYQAWRNDEDLIILTSQQINDYKKQMKKTIK
jgi:CDP-glucose 4,6-dehydratase